MSAFTEKSYDCICPTCRKHHIIKANFLSTEKVIVENGTTYPSYPCPEHHAKPRKAPNCVYKNAPCDYGGSNPKDCADCKVFQDAERRQMEADCEAERLMGEAEDDERRENLYEEARRGDY